MVRGHWVPTIPGYAGHIPGKHSENVCGGGIMHTCKMAGRAIAERSALPDPPSRLTLEDVAPRSRLTEHYHARKLAEGAEPSYEKMQLAMSMREHCERQIPGYTGHVPRVFGESVCGATSRNANLLAAELSEDKIFNPENHHNVCNAPQAPPARKLRF